MCLERFSKKVLNSNGNRFLVRIVKCLWLRFHARAFGMYSTVSAVLCIKIMPHKPVMIIAWYCSFLYSLLKREKGVSIYNFFHGSINPERRKSRIRLFSGNSQKEPTLFNGYIFFFHCCKELQKPTCLAIGRMQSYGPEQLSETLLKNDRNYPIDHHQWWYTAGLLCCWLAAKNTTGPLQCRWCENSQTKKEKKKNPCLHTTISWPRRRQQFIPKGLCKSTIPEGRSMIPESFSPVWLGQTHHFLILN